MLKNCSALPYAGIDRIRFKGLPTKIRFVFWLIPLLASSSAPQRTCSYACVASSVPPWSKPEYEPDDGPALSRNTPSGILQLYGKTAEIIG